MEVPGNILVVAQIARRQEPFFQVSAVEGGGGTGRVDGQGLHCWCDENYQCLGGRVPPAQAESLWKDFGGTWFPPPGCVLHVSEGDSTFPMEPGRSGKWVMRLTTAPPPTKPHFSADEPEH